MSAGNSSDRPYAGDSPIRFENLEERLLLTTLYGGDFFIYWNSKSEMVRVDLVGDETDEIELLSLYDIDGDNEEDVIDLVGFYNGQFRGGWYRQGDPSVFPPLIDPITGEQRVDPITGEPLYDVPTPGPEAPNPYTPDPTDPDWLNDNPGWIPNIINWPQLAPPFSDPYRPDAPGGGTIVFDDGEWQWVEYNYAQQNPDPNTRGANTEIYSIYVISCSPDTRLVISALTEDELEPYQNNFSEFYDISRWDSDSIPNLTRSGGSDILAPNLSGGVLVGGEHWPVQGDPVHYQAITTLPYWINTDIYPGITVYDQTARPVKDLTQLSSTFAKFNLIAENEEPTPQDMGRIIIYGTVSGGERSLDGTLLGGIQSTGNIDVIMMGFLWGNITVGQNLNNLILRTGGGARDPDGDYTNGIQFSPWGSGSLIHVEGTLTYMTSDAFWDGYGADGYTLFSAVEVENNPTVPDPNPRLYELEYEVSSTNDAVLDSYALRGELFDVNNDSMERAQFLNHPTGNFTIDGEISGHYTGSGADQDWYGLPLMAGQTIILEGQLFWGGGWDPTLAVHLYGPADNLGIVPANPLAVPDRGYDLRWMGSYGYETVEDWGLMSKPEDGTGTPKPLVFTAPSAGVYYIYVGPAIGVGNTSGNYHLKITNGTHGALGGVNVVGDYYSYWSGTGEADSASIATKQGGDLGAVVISEDSYGNTIAALQGGDLVCFQAGEIGALIGNAYYPDTIISDGYIGRVASTKGHLGAWSIEAGSDGGYYTGFYGTYAPYDAHIQNIYAATDLLVEEIITTGSIGVIESGTIFLSNTVRVNRDWQTHSGPAGHIDFIHVGDDVNHIEYYTGPGGDIGYIHIGGELGVWVGSIWHGWLQGGVPEMVVTDGSQVTLNDDSGGQLTIKPGIVTDQYGNELYDASGDPIYATYAYTYIPINSGAGGVIANLRIEGSATLVAEGLVQISNLNVNYLPVTSGTLLDGTVIDTTTAEYNPKILINGSGTVDIYYLDGYTHQTIDDPEVKVSNNYVELSSFINNTPGNLVSGAMADIDTIKLKGDLGRLDAGYTAAWLFGYDKAPMINPDDVDEVEPQFGWFHGTINGLNIVDDGSGTLGNLNNLRIDGYLGDLRVEGRLGIVGVDADGVTDPGRWDDWDGVGGLVWSQERIDYIDVGDGLADDGDVDVARAGIMCTASIGTVYISGNRYEKMPDVWEGPNETLKRPKVFGELNGSIIGRTDDVITVRNIYRTLDGMGNVISEYEGPSSTMQVDAIDQVIGEGSTLTALVLGVGMDNFKCYFSGGLVSGTIGTVSFTGEGAEIYGIEIFGQQIRNIYTSANSNGISHCYFNALTGRPDVYGIDQIVAGGPGMSYTQIVASSSSIGTIKTAGDVADIIYCHIESTDALASISARDLRHNRIEVPGGIGSISATRDIVGEAINTGAIESVSVGRNFLGNNWLIASELTSMEVEGYFDSVLTMEGGEGSYLKSLLVTGDIAGVIDCSGHIGSIISETGQIRAAISTEANEWNSDVELIQTAAGYTGSLDVAGSIREFISYASLGNNPAEHGGTTQQFNVFGDWDYLSVKSEEKGTQVDMFADINVGGNIGIIDVDGTLYSNITANGNLNKLYVDGSLGGNLGALGNRGSITVFGNLKSLKFDTSRDLIADITVGSSIQKLSMKGGSIIGNITSLHGRLDSISVKNGHIIGDLTAAAIGKITVNGSLIGDVTAKVGDIKSVNIKGGDLFGKLIAESGRIKSLNIAGGSAMNLDGFNTAGFDMDEFDIYAYAGIGKITIKGGNLEADVYSGRGIDSISVKGSNLTGMVSAETGIAKINVAGTIANTTIRSCGTMGKISAGSLDNAIISSAWDMGTINFRGSVKDSYVLAGYDVGVDGLLYTADDNPVNNNVVHAGDIKSIVIGGQLEGSVIAAGIGPDSTTNTFAEYLNDLDNVTEAAGTSYIHKISVKAGYPVKNAVLADTYVDSKFAVATPPGQVAIYAEVANREDGTGTDFGPDTLNGKTLTIGGLTLTLSSGTANYDAATGDLVLEETNDKSSLTLTYTGAGVYGNTINIISSDDSALASLKMSENIILGNTSIDGFVKTLQIGDVETGSTWELPAGLKSAKVNSLADVDITADAIDSLYAAGDVSGTITTILGDASKISVGNLYGDINVRGSIKSLTVVNNLAGNVNVTNGDLATLKAGEFTGHVTIARGWTSNVTISEGNFEGSYRSAGVKTFKVSQGDFTGLLCTGGDLWKLDVRNGQISGRVAAGGNINAMAAESLDNALLSACGYFAKSAIKADMTYSYIIAGFDPGDTGYSFVNDEDGNVALDRWDAPIYEGQEDVPVAGTITSVYIGGDMRTSTISAAVDPGDDGYCGTGDDVIRGTGYIYKVKIKGHVYGDGGADRRYGVFAANNMPDVTVYDLPFPGQINNVYVMDMSSAAGYLGITEVRTMWDSITIIFNHPLDFSTVDNSVIKVTVSEDGDFNNTTLDNTIIYGNEDPSDNLAVVTYNMQEYAVTITLVNSSWEILNAGSYTELWIDGEAIADLRGNTLRHDAHRTLIAADVPDLFTEADKLQLIVDGGTITFGSTFESSNDIDIFGFSANAYEFFSAEFISSPYYYPSWVTLGGIYNAQMALFHHDDQGTTEPDPNDPLYDPADDDFYELVARWEDTNVFGDVFEAFELPETGDYYLVAAAHYAGGPYELSLTLSSSDEQLVDDIDGLPAEEEIAYVSNYIGEHNNKLGANYPKQLVYLDFDGGTTTKYFDINDYLEPWWEDLIVDNNVPIEAFDFLLIDDTLVGYEEAAINGDVDLGVTGIVENMMSIYRNTPASHPLGQLTVEQITDDWSGYYAADEGLWFTTVDPTTQGLDPETDFTTVFVGEAESWPWGGGTSILGIASDVDLANVSKADNAIVFAQNFADLSIAPDMIDRLNEYSRLLANTIGHELGHVLGLNHQPTYAWLQGYWLLADDPDNNPDTPDDSNQHDFNDPNDTGGVALMSYPDLILELEGLDELGTAPVDMLEFPIGWIDTADLLLKWLA